MTLSRRLFLLLPVAVLTQLSYSATNIDPLLVGQSYGWFENAGWLDLRGDVDNGVVVAEHHLSGFAWQENVGWMFFGDGSPAGAGNHYTNTAADDCGVNRDADGNLSGFAWCENAGWVAFDTSGAGGSRVTIDPYTGEFSGFAWAENLGWLCFDGLDGHVAQAPAFEYQVTMYADDDFTTDVTNPTPGGTSGWVPFSAYQVGQATDYDADSEALRVTISTGGVPRINGWVSANSEWMPYALVGSDQIVRAKFYMFRAGQTDPDDLNQVPNMRLRVATRFAVNSMLEVFNHLAGDVAGTAVAREMLPKSDPTTPSVYRIDFDPVDVPALGTSGEGMLRGFEAYSLEPQENGSLEMAESMIGTYPVVACPDSGPEVLAEKVFACSSSDAGDLRVFNSLTDGPFVRKFVILSPGILGSEVALDGATDPTCSESPAGVTLDTSLVASNRFGLGVREFTEVGANSERLRVDRDRQYKIRWHVVSATNSNRNPQLRLRARSIKFMWSQKLEIGGALAAGNQNNAIAQQALPGVGCQNPDQMIPGENGGWYVQWLHTPLSYDIRDSQPLLAVLPGPGSTGNSMRDIKFGMDIMDTLSGMTQSTQEKGGFTLDRIEVRAYELVRDW